MWIYTPYITRKGKRIYAKSYGLKVIWALSLPGKIAPVSSGAIIKDTIMNIIKELGV